MATAKKYTGPKLKGSKTTSTDSGVKAKRSALARAISEQNNTGRTANGGLTNKSSLNACVDLHFQMGASRGKDLTKQFYAAFRDCETTATRQLLYLRDAREGVGERQQFRNLFKILAQENPAFAARVAARLPELGRWDDVVFVAEVAHDTDRQHLFDVAIALIQQGLASNNQLCGKWMPRKGKMSRVLREGLELSPRAYRKLIVRNTNVVETKMCAQQWDQIDYDKLPGLAAARYQKAFARHDVKGKYVEYVKKVVAGEAKINAGSIFPHDVVKTVRRGNSDLANAQWKALPDFLKGNNEAILPVVDVSGSMNTGIGAGETTAMDVAIGMGLYLSERLGGPFKDSFITFSGRPTLQEVSGTLKARIQQMERAQWDMNTDLQAVFDLVLKTAVKAKLSEDEMPSKILILSDMEFDSCVTMGHGRAKDTTAFNAIREKYAKAGYQLPQIVFWNINARAGNSPVTYKEAGTALISGYSPSIVTSVLGGKVLTPVEVMMQAVGRDRYDF